MKRLPFLLAVLVAGTAAAHSDRVLDASKPAAGVKEVVIEVSVGDLEVIADESGTISAHVEIERKGGGFWGSSSSRGEIEALEIDARINGSTMTLRLRPERRHNRHYSENWTVRLPAGCAVKIEQGVGNVVIRDVAGNLDVELGVGDIEIDGLFASFGRISAECGVGDVTVRTPEGRERGEGFVGHEAHTKGGGDATLNAEAGVGDVTIRLR
jgi:hypothetical protein